MALFCQVQCLSSLPRNNEIVFAALATQKNARIWASESFIGCRNVVNHVHASKSHFQVCLATKRNDNISPKSSEIEVYRNIEGVFSNSIKLLQDGSGNWKGKWLELEGSWVIGPTSAPAFAVVHFIGGVFVGASPQLVYRLFLEKLAERGVVVIATPYSSGFDHFRIADETQFKFDTCFRSLSQRNQFLELESLPVFGLGHSLGALTHVLIGSRYGVQRQGNILLSYNNREASAAIPALSSTIIPLAQRLSPILTTLAASKSLQGPILLAIKQLEMVNPLLSKSVKPLLEQLPSLYDELENGGAEFTPSPADTKQLVKAYYGVKRNLLISFNDDSLDETPDLAQTLMSSSIVDQSQVTVRVLPGTHTRPLQQPIPDLPPAMADTIAQGASLFSSFASSSPFAGIAGEFAKGLNLDELRNSAIEDTELLVDEIEEWMKSASKQQKLLSSGL